MHELDPGVREGRHQHRVPFLDGRVKPAQRSIAMNIINSENAARRAFNLERGLTLFRNGRASPLLVAAALWIGMACATSYAQTVIGSPGAGFQHWTVGDLNNNGAPY